ncbi:MAG TPA: CDP-alcohol phosphatidyltransferase family protein, partial [Kofleriaceae bacterium]|nr:CDP-alcohol phosphatidyltransferase family protein [Kofleriaceae bacterium]
MAVVAAGPRVPAAPAPRVVSLVNPANAVTASRFLCLPPFAWAVDQGHHQWATLFILVCGLLDKLDGLMARIFDCRSPFGELFDAITDGICYGFSLILVAAYGWAPV